MSLMQEGIEMTEPEAPETPALELQEALAGPLATPICMRLGHERRMIKGLYTVRYQQSMGYSC